jgi:hypothetical protein
VRRVVVTAVPCSLVSLDALVPAHVVDVDQADDVHLCQTASAEGLMQWHRRPWVRDVLIQVCSSRRSELTVTAHCAVRAHTHQ